MSAHFGGPPPMPARVAPHSPFSQYALHPPRTPEPKPITVPKPGLAVALLWCAFVFGTLAGLTLSTFWREIATVATVTAVSAIGGWVVYRTDRRTR